MFWRCNFFVVFFCGFLFILFFSFFFFFFFLLVDLIGNITDKQLTKMDISNN